MNSQENIVSVNQTGTIQNLTLTFEHLTSVPDVRAATVNRNIAYPRFRTHGSVRVRLFQISVRSWIVFFLTINVVKTDILAKKSYKI